MKKFVLAVMLLSFGFLSYSLEPVGYSVPFKMTNSLAGIAQADQEVVAFKGAGFIKIHLKELRLNQGDSFSISNGNELITKIYGPFENSLWLPSVLSDAAYLELEKGSNEAPFFEIDEVGLGLSSTPPHAESICGIDDRKNAVCYDSSKQLPGNAVGRMLFAVGSAWYLCTGSLVSQEGHFLTNNHCVEDQYGASTMEVWWKYQADTCGGVSGGHDYVTTGAQFLATDHDLDFTLLQLDDISPSQKYGYLRIANRPPVQGEVIWIPQHGGGSIKTFAVNSDLEAGAPAKIIDDSLEGWFPDSDIGYYADTEGGASGSPVLDSNNKIIALHHFGLPAGYSCDANNMNQGVKMSLIYPKITTYINLHTAGCKFNKKSN
jgi:lysyl endopeptidase